jgi:hypothetical protein
MRDMWWVVAVVATVVLVATYLTWTAARVDRLHARAAAAYATLDAHLVRRAVAASTLAEAAQVPTLMFAARIALDARPDERETAENDLTRHVRSALGGPGSAATAPEPAEASFGRAPGGSAATAPEPAEASFGRAPGGSAATAPEPAEASFGRAPGGSAATAPEPAEASFGRAPGGSAFATLVAASRRVALARQVHNDVVRDALAVRRRVWVRVFRLTRKHPRPAYFDVDDPTIDRPAVTLAREPR